MYLIARRTSAVEYMDPMESLPIFLLTFDVKKTKIHLEGLGPRSCDTFMVGLIVYFQHLNNNDVIVVAW